MVPNMPLRVSESFSTPRNYATLRPVSSLADFSAKILMKQFNPTKLLHQNFDGKLPFEGNCAIRYLNSSVIKK